MNEISQDDAFKRAVKLADWLGFPWSHALGIGIESKYFNIKEFNEWLISAPGDRAIRTKLKAEGYGIYEETGKTVISWADDLIQGDCLIETLLKMLKERE